jgi:anti-sigma B factor antagonist
VELQQRNAGPIVILDVKRSEAGDASAQLALRDRLRSLLDQGCKLILLNVADVAYVDSVLLSAIVQGYASAIRQGGTLKLLHVTARLRKLLKITKLDTVIDSYETEEAATASFHVDAR